MTSDEIQAHLETLKSDTHSDRRIRADDALCAEYRRLRAACDMARRAGVGDFGECREALRSFVVEVGNPGWIKSVERREGRVAL